MSELEQILARSMAAEPFKIAVRSYGMASAADCIFIDGYAPAVKVRRLLTHILATESHLPIEQVTVRARSGCSDFVGTVKLETATDTHVYLCLGLPLARGTGRLDRLLRLPGPNSRRA